MNGKSKVKIVKKASVAAAEPKMAGAKAARVAAREMVSNVTEWVTEFKSRKSEETKAALEMKSAELAAMRDQMLRLGADFENLRKRSHREIEEARKMGTERLARERDILAALDMPEAAVFAASGFDTSRSPGQDIPEHPIIFSKVPECVIAPGATISGLRTAGHLLRLLQFRRGPRLEKLATSPIGPCPALEAGAPPRVVHSWRVT